VNSLKTLASDADTSNTNGYVCPRGTAAVPLFYLSAGMWVNKKQPGGTSGLAPLPEAPELTTFWHSERDRLSSIVAGSRSGPSSARAASDLARAERILGVISTPGG
jgi:hypothetical protein